MATIVSAHPTDRDPPIRSAEPPIRPANNDRWQGGAVTRALLRRTGLVYATVVLLGIVPMVIHAGPGWQAAGIGLWFPGGGFVADGGWAILLLPVTILLFGVAFFAWFGSGMIAAPILVWLGSAVLAGTLAGESIWAPSPLVVAGMGVLFGLDNRRRTKKRHRGDETLRQERQARQPAAEAALARRAETARAHLVGELDPDQLASVRYLLDRALQPREVFGGYDVRDIFQTAALRYQINFLGYGLAQAQAHYTPSFHGYLSEAQRLLIDKYLLPRVWNYWVYESIWGHLNVSDWNPAAKDNIMLTGYFVPQMALYASTTGDQRYSKPGSLTFRLNKRQSWVHDVHSINRSVIENMRRSAYCLYPCEPNWIYPGCNMKGMAALAAHDLAYGTTYVEEICEPFLHGFEAEFMSAAGKVVPLKSSITGMPLPFPGSDASYSNMINIFAPQRATKKWAMDAAELIDTIKLVDGVPMLDLPDDGIDFGNYGKGSRTFSAAMLLGTAREFGDREIADATLNTLNYFSGRTTTNGTASYAKGSNLANATAAAGIIARKNSLRDLYNRPPAPGVPTGPLLAEASYPDVLVARAVSDGTDLDLVLYGTPDGATRRIGLARLIPDTGYNVADRPDLDFRADAQGKASVSIRLSGRTVLHIRKA